MSELLQHDIPIFDIYGYEMTQNQLALALVMIATFFFEFCPGLPQFVARKCTHMTSGTMLLFIQYTAEMKLCIYLWAIFVVSQAVNPIRKWRFAHKNGDPGIIFFGVIISLWCALEWDYRRLIPIFFCDPLAAVVGKSLKTPRWYKNKTIAGTLACAFTCFIVLPFTFDSITLFQQTTLSISLALAEAFSGDYDNIVMAIPIIVFGIFVGENKI